MHYRVDRVHRVHRVNRVNGVNRVDRFNRVNKVNWGVRGGMPEAAYIYFFSIKSKSFFDHKGYFYSKSIARDIYIYKYIEI